MHNRTGLPITTILNYLNTKEQGRQTVSRLSTTDWINSDVKVALFPTATVIALALRSTLAILRFTDDANEGADLDVSAQHAAIAASGISLQVLPEHNATITALQAGIPEDTVTDIGWLAFASQKDGRIQISKAVLLVGTAFGYLQIHSRQGIMLHRQKLHDGPVQRIRIASRTAAYAAADGTDADDDDDVIVVFSNAVVRIAAQQLQRVVVSTAQRVLQGGWDSTSSKVLLPVAKWDVSAHAGARRDAVLCNKALPSLRSLLVETQHSTEPTTLQLVTAGRHPNAIAAFDVDASARVGVLRSVSQAATSLAHKLYSAGLDTVSRLAASGAATRSQYSEDDNDVPLSVPAAMWRSIADDPSRIVESLSIAPNCRMALAADVLGRVLLLDLVTMCVLRMWKGYREVQCAWLTVPENGGAGGGARNDADAAGAAHVVLYAPRREVLEIWPATAAVKLKSINCSKHCRLLQPAPPLLTRTRESDVVMLSMACYLLDGTDGSLTDVLSLVNL